MNTNNNNNIKVKKKVHVNTKQKKYWAERGKKSTLLGALKGFLLCSKQL